MIIFNDKNTLREVNYAKEKKQTNFQLSVLSFSPQYILMAPFSSRVLDFNHDAPIPKVQALTLE